MSHDPFRSGGLSRIPFNDLKRHAEAMAPCLEFAVSRVIASGWFVGGPELEAFEREFAAYVGVRHAAGTGNGTDAIELALRACGVKPGDRVVTVANAGGYSTVAIRAIGAEPVYCDVLEATMNMDPAALTALVDGAAAVLVTHLYGRMADMPQILRTAERAGLPVIEDCAQAHGAEIGGRSAGAWGMAACFSFYPTKNLGSLGDGGAVLTDIDAVAQRVRSLRQYGWSDKYHVSSPGGRNSRLDELQAAVLRAKLPLLHEWNKRRKAIASAYEAGLAELRLAPPLPGEGDYVAHLYVIRTERRGQMQAALRSLGIGTEVHYPVADHQQAPWRGGVHLPVTERLCSEVLSLPCFPEMTQKDVETVIRAVHRAETEVYG